MSTVCMAAPLVLVKWRTTSGGGSFFCIEELLFDPVRGIPLDARAKYTESGMDSWLERINELSFFPSPRRARMPCLLSGGGMAVLFLEWGRWVILPSLRVAIAIAAVDGPTIPMTDPLHAPLFGSDIKRAAGTHHNASHMDARILARGHTHSHQVARLETLDRLGLLGTRAWETTLIHAAHLATSTPRRCDEPGTHACHTEHLRRTCSYTSRIQPMRFGKMTRGPIVLRASARATLDRQSRSRKPLVQCPARRIDRCCIFERRFRLSQDTG